MGRYGHSQERPTFKPLLATTTRVSIKVRFPGRKYITIEPICQRISGSVNSTYGSPHHLGKMSKKE